MFRKKKISLEVILDNDFDGIMHGHPEESFGCKLKGKVVLNNSKSLVVKHMLFLFIGKSTVACGPPMDTTRPECRFFLFYFRNIFFSFYKMI